jgi:hypothetical protein
MGHESVSNILSAFQGPAESGAKWERLAAWNQAFEYIRIMSKTPKFKDANIMLREECLDVPIDWFNVSETRGVKMLEKVEVFQILGHCFVYQLVMYILDYSVLHQVHAYSKFWEGTHNYCVNNRI